MTFNILVLYVKYRGKPILAFGVGDTCDSVAIFLSPEYANQIRKDEYTMSKLPNYCRMYLESCNGLGETEVYHFTGQYGHLEIGTKEIPINGDHL